MKVLHLVWLFAQSSYLKCDGFEMSERQSVEIKVDGEIRDEIEDVIPTSNKHLSNVRFTNRIAETVEIYYANPNGQGELQHILESGTTKFIDSWVDHMFYFTPIGSNGGKDTLFDEVVMDQSTGFVDIYDVSDIKGKELQQEAIRFQKKYYEDHGRRWENWWPREPIIHHLHQVDHIGDVIQVTSDRSQFHRCTDDSLSEEDIIVLDDKQAQNELALNSTETLQQFRAENEWYHVVRINGTTYCREKVDPDALRWNITNICNSGPNAFRRCRWDWNKVTLDHFTRRIWTNGLHDQRFLM